MELRKKSAPVVATAALCLALAAACSTSGGRPAVSHEPPPLTFGAERRLGDVEMNPSTPFLRFSPDGRLYGVWTEDDPQPGARTKQSATHHRTGGMAPSATRAALLAWSDDGGKSWSKSTRINSSMEAVQGEENGPRIAFGDKKVYVVWSIPGDRGNRMRANIRFAMDDGKGGFTPARTLNEVEDAARFPVLEVAPDGTLLIAWIDRRIDNPTPRQLYLMRLGATGEAQTKNYSVGEGLCECCRLGIAFADGGKTIYMVDREVNKEQIRNHALRKSTDGGISFGPPVEISDDGWKVPSCPHSGPTIGQDLQGDLHVTWFTLGRSPQEAGVYYAVSKDGGRSFAPRQLIHANTGPALLHTTLAVGRDGKIHFAWDNLDSAGKSQVFFRTLAPDGRSWGPIQQLSQAKENAVRPVLALSDDDVHVAWTEQDGEASWIALKSAPLAK